MYRKHYTQSFYTFRYTKFGESSAKCDNYCGCSLSLDYLKKCYMDTTTRWPQLNSHVRMLRTCFYSRHYIILNLCVCYHYSKPSPLNMIIYIHMLQYCTLTYVYYKTEQMNNFDIFIIFRDYCKVAFIRYNRCIYYVLHTMTMEIFVQCYIIKAVVHLLKWLDLNHY